MKMCQTHWDQLRKKVDEAGMGHLVPISGEEASQRMARVLEQETPSLLDFDPLMNAFGMIAENAIQAQGIKILFGDYCPICVGQCPDWLDHATNDTKEIYEKLKKEYAQ